MQTITKISKTYTLSIRLACQLDTGRKHSHHVDDQTLSQMEGRPERRV